MNVGERIVRKGGASRVAPAHGARPAQGPGWRESVIQRPQHRQKRCGGRGTGAVMATGSYEGSLPTEGIPDRFEASTVTRGVEVGLGGPITLDPRRHSRDRERAVGYGREGGRSSRGRTGGDRDVRGTIASSHRGKTTPTPMTRRREAEVLGQSVEGERSAEAVSDGVKRPVPRSSHAEPKLSGTSTR
jgi:hypothetical protein